MSRNNSKQHLVKQTLINYYSECGDPYSLAVLISLRYNCSCEDTLLPLDFDDPDTYLTYVQSRAFIKKNVFYVRPDKSPSNACKEEWYRSEAKCKDTNETLPYELKTNFSTRTFFETVRHFCHKILGDFSLGEIDFGPGASFLLEGKDANYKVKLSAKPECTSIAHRDVLINILDQMPLYSISNGLVIRDRTSLRLGDTKLPCVPGNRFSTVPKTSVVDRPIGIEPLGNMLLQKGIGNTIRRKLMLFGLHINTRPDLHRKLILSVDRDFATIDLSSASDTIATNLVKFLLPVDWFDYLNKIRSHRTYIDNEWFELSKFSSMGNGFTFELETLIFYAILLASRYHYGKSSDFISAFGDDMIVPAYLYEDTCRHLVQAGFIVNLRKSFSTGPFRESCGADGWVHNGRVFNVRPVYLKPSKTDDMTTFILKMYHRFYEAAVHSYDNSHTFIDKKFKKVLRRLRQLLLNNNVPVVPFGFSPDAGFYPLPDLKPKGRGKTSVRVYNRLKIPTCPHLVLSYGLYGLDSRGLVTRSASFRRAIRHSNFVGFNLQNYTYI